MPAANGKKKKISQHQTVSTPEENLLNWKQIWVMRWEREERQLFALFSRQWWSAINGGCSLPMRPTLTVSHHSVGECCKALLNESKVFIKGRLVSCEHIGLYTLIQQWWTTGEDGRSDHMVNTEGNAWALQSSPMKLFQWERRRTDACEKMTFYDTF